jgi:predicted acyl esterase
MNLIGDRDDPFWAGREPYKKAVGATTPVLWSHGFYDANTKPVHLDIWNGLAGPKQAWFGQYTHVRGHEAAVGRRGFLDQAFRFLDLHVRGVESPVADPAVTVQEGNPPGKWRLEAQWPPADAQPWAMPLRAGSYDDMPGNDAGSGDGSGVWTFTRPLPGDAHVAGEMRLDVPVTTSLPGAHLVALVYDLDQAGKAVFVQRGAMALPAAGAQRAAFALYPQDWRFKAGHRIAVRVAPGDDDWFSPPTTGAPVEVGAGTLTLPLLANRRTASVAGGASDGMKAVSTFTLPAATIAAGEVDALPPAQTG